MSDDDFFEDRLEQSEIKARIVQKYFYLWARIIAPTAQRNGGKIAYVDLFAGPGRYKDGSISTPLLVLKKAIDDPKMANMLVSLFNDQNQLHTDTLQSEINDLPGIEKLRFKPQVRCTLVDEDVANYFNSIRLIPTFSFVDPFGYKALSLKMVKGFIKDWGCDCLFFFNYSRVNAGLSYDGFNSNMNAIFGEKRAKSLKIELEGKSPSEREAIVLENLAQAIKEMGGKYVLPFKLKKASGTRTSHNLIFVSKHFKGYETMKAIMAEESSTTDQGVASFEYSPASAATPLLFSLDRKQDFLVEDLMSKFAGQTKTCEEIYLEHSVDTPYVMKNYKKALLQLEAEKRITAEPSKRKPNTFGDGVRAHFLRT